MKIPNLIIISTAITTLSNLIFYLDSNIAH